MKRMLMIVMVAMIGVASIALAGDEAKKEAAKPVTMTGEVLDMYCYMDHHAMGMDHAKCAMACAKKGLPLGFLSTDGTLYLITGKDHEPANAMLAEYCGKQSTITGVVQENNGMKAIELVSIADAKAEKSN